MPVKPIVAGAIASLGLSAAAHAADQPWTLHEALGAPEALTVAGSVRLRYEAIDGHPRPGFGKGEDFVAIRTQLFAEYKAGPVRIGGEIFDSRVYGADRLTALSTTDVNALEPVQAYVALDLKAPFGPKSSASVELGRMMINIGSRRLVAADDYRNVTQGSTGLKLDGKWAGGWSATAIYVAPQIRLPDDLASLGKNQVVFDEQSTDQLLWGGIATKAGLWGKTALDLEYFGLDERDAPGRATRNRNLHTWGARIIRAPEAGVLDYEVEGFRQTGTVRASLAANAAILDVSAGFLHAEAGYQFRGPAKARLALEYDVASGDKGAGRYNRFDTLFGMRRADLAPSGLFNAITRANIETVGLRLEAAPSPRWDAFAKVNLMWLESATDAFATTNVRDPTGRSGRYAGELAEARVRYWIVPRALRFEVNAVALFKGRFLEQAPNAPLTGDTFYGSAAITATF